MVNYTQAIRRLLPTNCLSVFDHFVVPQDFESVSDHFGTLYIKGLTRYQQQHVIIF